MISVRTGLADITEKTECKRIVLYPKLKNKGNGACSIHDAVSINKMYQREKDIEIEYDVKDPDAVTSLILTNF